MFNYPLKIVQICLRSLASASLPAYKRKLLITLIVLCTTEISFPFRSSPARDMALQNTQVNSTTYLNPKNISCPDICNRKALILLFSRYAYIGGDYYPYYFINYYIPKKVIMPRAADRLIYGRRRKGDTFFSQSEAKLSPINPQGPPSLYSEKFNCTSPAIQETFSSGNLITGKSTTGITQSKPFVFISNLGAPFLLKRAFFMPSKGTPNNPVCWSVNRKFNKKGGEKKNYAIGVIRAGNLRRLRKLCAYQRRIK